MEGEMAVYVEGEVLIANALVHRDAITTKQLYEYCERIKEAMNDSKNFEGQYVYFENDRDAIKNALLTYKECFVEINGKIHKYKNYDINYFNARFGKGMKQILKQLHNEDESWRLC
jgi:exo-beta-1,3-glucanase (GH17 family)